MGDPADRLNILHGAGDVGGMRTGHQPRGRLPGIGHRSGIDAAHRIAGHNGDRDHTARHKPVERTERGVVIGSSSDHVVSGDEQAVDRHVEAEGCSRRKCYPLWIDAAEQAGRRGPTPLTDRIGGDRLPIARSASRGAVCAASLFPGRIHLRRLRPRGGGVVEIPANGQGSCHR